MVTEIDHDSGHRTGDARASGLGWVKKPVIQETIFVMPGLGSSTLNAIINRDYTQLELNVLFIAIVYVAMNLLVDLAYGWLDPRIKEL